MKTKLLYVLFFTALFSQAQVSLVKDVNPGVADGLTDQMINYNGTLLFTGNNTVDGYELWKSDGTTNGTNYITSGNTAYNPDSYYYSPSSNKVYFTSRANSVNLNITDGTLAGTVSVNNYVNPKNYFDFQNKTFFACFFQLDDEMCVSEGTASSTAVFKDLRPSGPYSDSSPSDFTEFNGNMYFAATTVNEGRELWVSDGSVNGTNLFLDIANNASSSTPSNFKVFNNKLYFTADDGSAIDIWETDGTIAGTQKTSLTIAGFPIPSGALSNISNFFTYNNALYFTATSATNGNELVKMDTAGNIIVLEIATGASSSSPFGFTVFNNEIYFAADDVVNGVELWKTDGTQANTVLVKNINTSTESTPQGFVEYFGELYFNADDGVHGRELWRTDGTNAGTVMVDDINTGALSSEPQNLTVAGDNLFFSATTPTTGRELYKYIDPSLSLQENELVNAIELYPNPANEFFTIKTNTVIKSVTVYDVQGKVVKKFASSLTSYNIEDITSGLYFMKIKTDKGEVTKKIMVK